MSLPPQSAGQICTACGLCCDGTLFSYALLRPDESEPARAMGFEILRFDEREGFAQPCRQLCGTRCAVYEARPQVCRKYRCTTLLALDRGDIDSAEALRRVEQARAAVARLQPELLAGETIGQARGRFQGLAGAEDRRTHGRFLLLLAGLELILDRYFRTPGQRAFKPGGTAMDDAAAAAEAGDDADVSATGRDPAPRPVRPAPSSGEESGVTGA